jgi:hypothetical protein
VTQTITQKKQITQTNPLIYKKKISHAFLAFQVDLVV